MIDITKIDKNMIDSKVELDDIVFYDADSPAFHLYGVYRDGDRYRRLPEAVAMATSEDVHSLHAHTAGGRIKFKTDSRYVVIHAKMENIVKLNLFPLTGTAGFDLYAENEHIKTFRPPWDVEDGYEGGIEFASRELREYTLHFPTLSDVKALYIGLDETAVLEEASPYRNVKPIVYYGSSITQGSGSSRPGVSYENMLSRRLNCDYVNLGFAGSALGEEAITDYIKGLEMSVFVLDYDYNAPTVEHLKNTHEKMFMAIRQAQSSLPIIMMSRPIANLNPEEIERRSVVETTYKNAIARGDQNVYFLDGAKLTELCGSDGTVDNCHPTDFGIASTAKALEEVFVKNNLLGE